jgi:hypothetical protein
VPTPADYPSWATYHATMFGFLPEDAGMLSLWVEQFAAEGIAPAELFAASRRLFSAGAPAWRRDHAPAILAAVREMRRPAAPAKPPEDPRGTCTLCRNSGYVVVPHPNTLYGKTPRWCTLAVTCRCAIGAWRRDQAQAYSNAQKRPIRFYTLDEFEREFPDWRDDVAAHEALLKARDKSAFAAGVNDKLFGRLLAGFKGREATP